MPPTSYRQHWSWKIEKLSEFWFGEPLDGNCLAPTCRPGDIPHNCAVIACNFLSLLQKKKKKQSLKQKECFTPASRGTLIKAHSVLPAESQMQCSESEPWTGWQPQRIQTTTMSTGPFPSRVHCLKTFMSRQPTLQNSGLRRPSGSFNWVYWSILLE